jgi:DNA-binding transcriptional MerR regulator
MLIGELAKVSGLSKDGIRHYEDLGLITSARKQAGSRWYNDYGSDALDAIDKVRQAQRLGFALKEIGPLMKAHAQAPFSQEMTVAFLEARLAQVRDKIVELRDIETFIVGKLDRYRTGHTPA